MDKPGQPSKSKKIIKPKPENLDPAKILIAQDSLQRLKKKGEHIPPILRDLQGKFIRVNMLIEEMNARLRMLRTFGDINQLNELAELNSSLRPALKELPGLISRVSSYVNGPMNEISDLDLALRDLNPRKKDT